MIKSEPWHTGTPLTFDNEKFDSQLLSTLFWRSTLIGGVLSAFGLGTAALVVGTTHGAASPLGAFL